MFLHAPDAWFVIPILSKYVRSSGYCHFLNHISGNLLSNTLSFLQNYHIPVSYYPSKSLVFVFFSFLKRALRSSSFQFYISNLHSKSHKPLLLLPLRLLQILKPSYVSSSIFHVRFLTLSRALTHSLGSLQDLLSLIQHLPRSPSLFMSVHVTLPSSPRRGATPDPTTFFQRAYLQARAKWLTRWVVRALVASSRDADADSLGPIPRSKGSRPHVACAAVA